MGVAKYIKNEKDEVQDVILQSGIHVKPLYTKKDLEDIRFRPGQGLSSSGRISLHPRNPSSWLPESGVDNPAVHGFRNTQRDQ